MKDLAGALVSPADYHQLVSLCTFGRPLPPTYDQWTELLEHAAMEAQSLNLPASPIAVDVQEFEQWCSKVGILPCLEALRAFLIVKRYADHAALIKGELPQ
jgi:hypothetical protein